MGERRYGGDNIIIIKLVFQFSGVHIGIGLHQSTLKHF